MAYRTKDQVAQEFIAEGKRRNITERGIVICIATGLVESNLTVYANAKVPASMSLPHDAVGSDGYSVGPLQQQVRDTGNGWWWGDAATCMDPTKSAGLFYGRLSNYDYNNPNNTPGSFAQSVQQSAFPDRYDQRMAEAQGIYDRLAGGVPVVTDPRPDFNEYAMWSPNNSGRGSVKPSLFLLHTQEGGGGDNAADDLAKYLQGNQVSYHYTVSQASDNGVTVVDVVDTDLASWSVGDANAQSINLCFAGSRASWTTDQWMQQSKAIDVAAYLAVQDCKKYGFSTLVVPPPYSAGTPGISDHRYVTDVIKWGTHTDVGPGFPWTYFAERVAFWLADGKETPPPVTTPPPAEKRLPQDLTDRELLEQIWDQLRGPGGNGWPQLGGKSLVDYVGDRL